MHEVKIEGLAAFLAEHGSCRVNIEALSPRQVMHERADIACAARDIRRLVRIEEIRGSHLKASFQP